jgi:hypothetical protein
MKADKKYTSAYEHLMNSSRNPHKIPEVVVTAKRPVKQVEAEDKVGNRKKSPTYTPSGSGGWTYYSSRDAWVNNQNGAVLSSSEYEKRFPRQLRQAGYNR